MTEQEWLAATDPAPMLDVLRGKASDRKLRLFACGCCWALTSRPSDRLPRRALITTESFADGEVTGDELHRVRAAVLQAVMLAGTQAPITRSVQALYAIGQLAGSDIVTVLNSVESAAGALSRPTGTKPWTEIRAEQQSTLRDIFGNPFRLVSIDPAWLTSDVLALAQGIYTDRAFDRMPYLADALQDAGCDNEDVLSHCRSEGPHCRGCWVVDLILGKA